MTNPKTILAYIRKSIVEDINATASPARQRAAIERRLAATHPDVNIEWFQDLDISGRYEANRPDWQRLLRRLDDKDVAGIAVESIDRAYRNVKEFLAFYDNVLAPQGKTLISTTQNIDMSTADGRAMASILLTFAEMESRKASERMTSTLKHLRDEGRHHGPNPFGCDRDPQTKHLIPSARAYLYSPATGEAKADEEDPGPGWERRYYHDALRALFEAYASGSYSLVTAATWLNANGWRCWDQQYVSPVEFKDWTIQSIVRRWQIYAGQIPAAPGHRLDRLSRYQVTMVEGSYAPILPVELCEAAGATLQARVGTGGPNQPALVYLCGGLVYCGTCGGKLGGGASHRWRDGQRQVWCYYRHTSRKGKCPEPMPRVEPIHQEVAEMISALLDSGLLDKVAAELRRIAGELAPTSTDGLKMRRREAEMERLINLHVKGLITEAEFTRHRSEIQAEIDKLKPPTQGHTLAEVEAIIGQLEGLLADFEESEPLLQKQIIRTLFERIEIKDRRISRVVPHSWCAFFFDAVWPVVVNSGTKISSYRSLHILDLIYPAP